MIKNDLTNPPSDPNHALWICDHIESGSYIDQWVSLALHSHKITYTAIPFWLKLEHAP